MATGTPTVCLCFQGPEAAQSIFSSTPGPPTAGGVFPACPCLQKMEGLSQPAPIPLAEGSLEARGNALVCPLTQGPVTPSWLVSIQEALPGTPFSTGPSPAGIGWSSTLLPSQHPEATLIACTFNHSSRILSWPSVPGRPFLSELGGLSSGSSCPDLVTHTDPAGPITSGSPTTPFTHTAPGFIAASTEPAVLGVPKALFTLGGTKGSVARLIPKGRRPSCNLPMLAQRICRTEDLAQRLPP